MPTIPLDGTTWEAALPCPFCNAPGQLLTSTALWNPKMGSSACVVCSRCGSGGPVVEPRDREMLVEDMNRQAIRLWNRRGSHQNTEWKLMRIAQILGSDFVERAK